MEELLNKLIEKGWLPFGIYGNWELEWERIFIEEQTDTNEYHNKIYRINVDYVEFNWLCDEDKSFSDNFSIRELTSKESWLWQFVTENKLLPKKNWYVWNLIDRYNNDITIKWIEEYNCLYYIIESALCDEDKLEQFLLDNIKIEWNDD